MFFSKSAARLFCYLGLLFTGGCAGKMIHEDPSNEVVPAGTAEVVSLNFNPSLRDFINSLDFSTFEDGDETYAGYYCPGIGVRVVDVVASRLEFDTTMAHEILHAVYTHGFVDEDAFAVVLDRLRTDDQYSTFVSEVTGDGWSSVVYTFCEQNEYFARVGEEIVNRRGINVPDYLWEIYGGILHHRLRENGTFYRQQVFPAQALTKFQDDTSRQADLLSHALGLRSVHNNVLPRADVAGYSVDLVWDGVSVVDGRMIIIQFRQRSSGMIVTNCSGRVIATPTGPRLQCYWDPAQARDILTAWLDYDLVIDEVDPMTGVTARR